MTRYLADDLRGGIAFLKGLLASGAPLTHRAEDVATVEQIIWTLKTLLPGACDHPHCIGAPDLAGEGGGLCEGVCSEDKTQK